MLSHHATESISEEIHDNAPPGRPQGIDGDMEEPFSDGTGTAR